MSEDSLDRLIKETYELNSYKIEDISSIEVPSLDKSMQKLIRETSLNKRSKKTFKKIFIFRFPKQLASVTTLTILILLVSTLLSIFSTTDKARAAKFNILKTFVEVKDKFSHITIRNTDPRTASNLNTDTNSTPPNPTSTSDIIVEKLTLNELHSKVKYPFITSTYLPEGYKFKEATRYIYPQNKEVIEQVYTNNTNELIISLTTNATNINTKITTSNKSTTKTIKVMNEDGTLISYDDNNHWLVWYKDDTRYEILAQFSEKELSKLIGSLIFSK
jgi:hypothetical protein